jgi:fructose-1,6-bisphosphatase/sedoheptulose 1,7-bisphosphatase-like protein
MSASKNRVSAHPLLVSGSELTMVKVTTEVTGGDMLTLVTIIGESVRVETMVLPGRTLTVVTVSRGSVLTDVVVWTTV